MAGQQLPPGQIDAQPTKTFFVDMLVRDIPLEQAVLDLVDNSVDGAKSMHGGADRFDGREIKLTINSDTFIIWDNCGGFSIETARDYAFRFGRKSGTPKTPHSIGQFGVGMKRALFKFGEHFNVRSATKDEVWAIDVDVATWEADEQNWHFPWSEFKDTELSVDVPGTEIIVDRLRPEVSSRFGTLHFINTIIGLIKSKHRQFISSGLSISVNGTHLDATNLYLSMTDQLRPGVDILLFEAQGKEPVNVRIVVGVGNSSPREAGWYVICNGRVILEADRRPVTGWGVLEEEAGRTLIPSYHNQFSRFRGIVSFDSSDSSRIPWNTTKSDVDQDNLVWQKTFQRMVEMMRPVIDFLNQLDADIDEHSREHSPLLQFVNKAGFTKVESLTAKSEFAAPARDASFLRKGPPTVKIQYSKPVDEIEFLQEALGVTSAKAVGEKTFELVLSRQRDS